MNSRILNQRFEYYTPQTVEEAIDLLERSPSGGKPIAGGTDLLVQMKQEAFYPAFLMDVRSIPDLKQLYVGERLRIGAAVTLQNLLQACSGLGEWAALSDALGSMATLSIRNLGTIGGNLCNASPAADSAPPLLALGATVRLVGQQCERAVPLKAFFLDANRTAAAPGELMTGIEVPVLPKKAGSAFMKNSGLGPGIAKVNGAALVTREGEVCTSCRIALGSVAPFPMRAEKAEAVLSGHKWTFDLLEEAGSVAALEIGPVTDLRSTESYRRHVTAYLVSNLLSKAWERTTI